jgi:hypothetical protein
MASSSNGNAEVSLSDSLHCISLLFSSLLFSRPWSQNRPRHAHLRVLQYRCLRWELEGVPYTYSLRIIKASERSGFVLASHPFFRRKYKKQAMHLQVVSIDVFTPGFIGTESWFSCTRWILGTVILTLQELGLTQHFGS